MELNAQEAYEIIWNDRTLLYCSFCAATHTQKNSLVSQFSASNSHSSPGNFQIFRENLDLLQIHT